MGITTLGRCSARVRDGTNQRVPEREGVRVDGEHACGLRTAQRVRLDARDGASTEDRAEVVVVVGGCEHQGEPRVAWQPLDPAAEGPRDEASRGQRRLARSELGLDGNEVRQLEDRKRISLCECEDSCPRLDGHRGAPPVEQHGGLAIIEAIEREVGDPLGREG